MADGEREQAGDEVRRRTAVIVIPGVGDQPSGGASQALTAGLLRHGADRFRYAECADEEYASHHVWCGVDPEDAQSVTRHTVYDEHRRPVADVYEAWWADLSRFRGATRSALLAAIGMMQQATTIGRAALRGGGPLRAVPDGDPGGVRAPWGFRAGGALLATIEWLLAVPVIGIVAVHVALFAAGDYAMFSDGAQTRHALVGMAVVALLLLLALFAGMAWYARRRPAVFLVGVPLVALAVALAAWRSVADGHRADSGIADAITAIAVYPLRLAWMLIAALAILTLACVVAQQLATRVHSGWARIGTAALSMFGPFGIGVIGALVYGAVGAALNKAAAQHVFTSPPWCLARLNDWTLQACKPSTKATGPLNAADWGLSLFQTGVIPLLYVAIVTAGILVLAALAVAASGLVELMRRRRVSRTMLLRRLLRVSPGAICWGALPASAIVLLCYLPGGDRVLFWEQAPVAGIDTPAVVAAAAGWVVGGLLAASRLLKLGTGTVLNRGSIGDGVRVPLDLAYDIATFLRQPSARDSRERTRVLAAQRSALARLRNTVPRQRILARFSALLAHIDAVRHYDRCLIVSHSQGTVLATALLAQPPDQLRIPGGSATLVTMGSPLRHLFAERLPVQFAWVCHLRDHPRDFVRSLQGPWYNFGADGDLVGRTVFSAEPDDDLLPPDAEPPVPVPHRGSDTTVADEVIGSGGHGSYWTSEVVMSLLAAIVDGSPAPLSVVGSGSATPVGSGVD